MYKLYQCIKKDVKTIVLCSGLGGHAHFWRPQLECLTQYFNVFIYDQKGILKESSELPDSYTLTMMAEELAELLAEHGISKCYFIGHALGAFVGMELAIHSDIIIEKMLLINPWAELDPHTNRCFSTRLNLLENSGIEAYIRAQALFLYPPSWISTHDEDLKTAENNMILNSCSLENIKKRLNALRVYQPSQVAQKLQVSCHVIGNQDDFLVPWQQGLKLAQLIPECTFKLFPHGGHASTVTQTAQINEEILYVLNAKSSIYN